MRPTAINFSDTTKLVTDCASTSSSPGLSSPVNERCDFVAGTIASVHSSDSSGVSDPCLEITSPDIATYYGTQRYPQRSKRQGLHFTDTRAPASDANGNASWAPLHGYEGSSGRCKRQRLLESHDSGKLYMALCAGKVWIHSHSAHESLVKSFGVSIEEYPDLAKIPKLLMKAWGKYHHPILPLAYMHSTQNTIG